MSCSSEQHLPWKTDTHICCTKTQCTKTFKDPDAFQRELDVYERNLSYVPRLIEADRERHTLVVENAGRPLGTIMDSVRQLLPQPLVSRLPDARRQYADRVRELHETFHRDTGLFHNDVQYKNVLRDDDDTLYLIDFEFAAPQLKDCTRHRSWNCWNPDSIF